MLTYNTTIIGLTDYRYKYEADFLFMIKDFDERSFSLLDKELAYDWIVINALNNVLNEQGGRVIGHYKHDIFACLYSYHKYFIEVLIRNIITRNKIVVEPSDIFKAMVADNVLILTRGLKDG